MNRDELLKALKAVMPGVSKGEALIQGADAFVLTPGLVQTYNDHISASYPLDIDLTAVVKAAEIVRVLEKMAGLDVTMTIDQSILTITDGKTKLSMKLMDAATTQLIQALDLEGLEWDVLPDKFIKMLGLCLSSVSSNPAHGVLTGILVSGLDILSSDNFRAAWAHIEHEVRIFIIPGTAVANLMKLSDLESYAVTDSWVHFMNKDGAIFSSRLLGGDFPLDSLKGLFPDDNETKGYELPEALRNSLELASVLSSSQDGVMDFVSLKRETGDLEIKGERQSGWVVDSIPVSDNGFPSDTEIHISPKYLLDIMSVTRKFNMVGNLLVFRGDGFQYLTSTISLEK